jgi:hypothetical protein
MRDANIHQEAFRDDYDDKDDSQSLLLFWALAVPLFWIALGYGIRWWVLS